MSHISVTQKVIDTNMEAWPRTGVAGVKFQALLGKDIRVALFKTLRASELVNVT